MPCHGPGEMAVYRSPLDGRLRPADHVWHTRPDRHAGLDFYAGPTSRFDLGNALVVDLLTGTLESVTDLTLFGGANALAIESAPGVWEIVQAGAAELIALGRYRLTRLCAASAAPRAPWATRRLRWRGSWCWTPRWHRCRSPRPISASRGTGASAPASRPVSDETYVRRPSRPRASGLRPFSVAHVEQPWRRPRTPGDLTIRWTRRSLRARRRQLGRAGGAAGRGTGGPTRSRSSTARP